MNELLGDYFFERVLLTAFVGIWVLSLISSVFIKTKHIENKRKKTIFRVSISCTLGCLWIYFLVYRSLYPISLAYYEYKNNSTNEIIGVVESIEQTSRDRVNLFIDDTEYTIVYSNDKPIAKTVKKINKGDVVKIVAGEKSKFVFEIYKSNTSSDNQ